jgi:Type I phosphodiesterase / nucleotide pyrophosphatase
MTQMRETQLLRRVDPDYAGGNIVNLVAAIARHFGLATKHPPWSAPLPLEGIDTVVLLIVDALGYWQLQGHLTAGDLPTLERYLARHEASLAPLTSTFPSTTPAALTTLHTGVTPADHGLVGFTIWWPDRATVAQTVLFRDLLRGTPLAGARRLVTVPSVYQQLAAFGVASHAVIPAGIVGSMLSAWHFAGARLHPYATLGALPDAIVHALATGGSQYVVAYWPEYDGACHEHGPPSSEARASARQFDAALERLLAALGHAENVLVILTADHGQRPLDPNEAIALNDDPVLARWLATPPVGERCARYLRIRPGGESTVERHLSPVAEVVRMADVWAAGLFGGPPAAASFRLRTGDLLAIPRGRRQLHWAFAETERTEVYRGGHGGWTEWEMIVPVVAIRR